MYRTCICSWLVKLKGNQTKCINIVAVKVVKCFSWSTLIQATFWCRSSERTTSRSSKQQSKMATGTMNRFNHYHKHSWSHWMLLAFYQQDKRPKGIVLSPTNRRRPKQAASRLCAEANSCWQLDHWKSVWCISNLFSRWCCRWDLIHWHHCPRPQLSPICSKSFSSHSLRGFLVYKKNILEANY